MNGRLQRLERLARVRRAERDLARHLLAETERALRESRDEGDALKRRRIAELHQLATTARHGTSATLLRTAAAGADTMKERIAAQQDVSVRAGRARGEALRRLLASQVRQAGIERLLEKRREQVRRAAERKAQRALDDLGVRARRIVGAIALCAALAVPAPTRAEDAESRHVGDPGIARLLQDIRARQLRLDQQEAELRDREQHVHALEAIVQARLSEAEEIAGAIEKRIADWEGAHEAKSISRLAKIYGTMEPNLAAPLLEDLELELATRIVAKMKPKQSAELLPLLSESRALAMSRSVAHPLNGAGADASTTP